MARPQSKVKTVLQEEELEIKEATKETTYAEELYREQEETIARLKATLSDANKELSRIKQLEKRKKLNQKQVTFLLDVSVMEDFRRYCKNTDQKQNAIVNKLLTDFMKDARDPLKKKATKEAAPKQNAKK